MIYSVHTWYLLQETLEVMNQKREVWKTRIINIYFQFLVHSLKCFQQQLSVCME